jgi:cell division septum initiation protein DivIVA
MSIASITSSLLRQLIPLVERKERLQKELAEIEAKLSAHVSSEAGVRSNGTARAPRTVARVSQVVQSSKTLLAPRRGALRDAIIAELKKASAQGVGARDLSAKLGVKNQNLHVWFSSTGRKIKGITKIGAGRWQYNGS